MSHYDELEELMICVAIISIITFPVWFPIFGITWIFKHDEWEKEATLNEERYRKEQERIIALHSTRIENNANLVKKAQSQEKMESIRNKLI